MATYDSALEWAKKNRPYQVSLIMQLGPPRADTRIPTAQVSALRDDSADQWEFVYNPDFFESLSDQEALGVMVHEVYHVLLHHLVTICDNITNDPKPFPNHQKLVLAHEFIVNDNVINDGHSLPDGVHIGSEKLGFDTSDYTTKEVYDLIPDDADYLQEPEHNTCSIGDLTDEEIKDLMDAMQGIADTLTDDEASQVSPVAADRQEKDGTYSKQGTEFDSAATYATKMDVGENWVNFIKKIDPNFLEGFGLHGKQRTTWAIPRKKFMSLYPRVILPNKITVGDSLKKNGGHKPHIVLALDFSGSIPRSTAENMARLARSLPSSIEVDCCTFSTNFVPFDHNRDDNNTASGGTSFCAVEGFVQSLSLDKYPKAVVVITDGGADFNDYYYWSRNNSARSKPTKDQLFNNWYWIATDRGYRSEILHNVSGVDSDKIFVLQDLFD